MRAWVGHQYTVEEVRHWYQYANPEKVGPLQLRAARIRAFDVPCFINKALTISRLDELAGVLLTLLSTHVLDWDWKKHNEEFERTFRTGTLKKYGVFHTTLLAPTDEMTQQPMVLEIVGHITLLNGQGVSRRWYQSFGEGVWNIEHQFLGQVHLVIQRATYANTDPPHIGVSFYL